MPGAPPLTLDLRLELRVPRCEPCRRRDGVEKSRVVQHRRIVDDHRDHRAVAFDGRDRASKGRRGKIDRPPRCVDVCVRLSTR